MYSIGCLYLSGYSIVSLQWSPVVSFAAPPLTSATSSSQCRFWPHVGCCVLLRGVCFWSLGPIWLLSICSTLRTPIRNKPSSNLFFTQKTSLANTHPVLR